jgi:hypothetical protein
MAITLAELIQPVTAEEVKALLLETLQGIGPVQQIGTGAGVVVPSGSPLNNYDVEVEITADGSPGTATFRYTLNGGQTFSVSATIPGGGVVTISGTGLTFTFAGVFVNGDAYIFQTVFPPLPVTDWESGGGARTLVEADAATLADLVGVAVADIAAGGLVEYASDDWLSLLSSQQYREDRYDPGATSGLVALTLASGSPDLSLAAGDLVISNSSGSGAGVVLFSNVAPLSIANGTTVVATFQAQQPGAAYNVQNNVLNVLKTPKPGLTVNNPAPGTSIVTHAGPGTGTVGVTGSPTGNYSVVARITTSGGLGVGAVQFSVDGGSNFASPLTIPSSGSYQLPMLDGVTDTGLTITFAGTFTSGDTYSFTSFASWVTVPGRDRESDVALAGRDIDKWSGLGWGGGTAATFDYLCRKAPNGGSEVTRTSVNPDTLVGGQVNLTIAGFNGPVSSSALVAITAFVKARLGLCAGVVISNSTTYTLAITAQIFTTAQRKSSVEAAIALAFQRLAVETQIGGKVYWSDLEAALNQKTAGVTSLYLTVPTPNTDTQLPSNATVGFDLTGLDIQLV